ncbi:NTP transferase domain-containing protein [Thermoplasmatales archaeon AK]|nr:NTP transferase domain-containing protein [Thermoplasmatales archaeon AK]
MARIRKAVIPAAGKGKRFYPLTRAQPKEMLPILDKPVIHYVVEEAVNSGLEEILIIVGYGKDAIINYFDKHELDDEMDIYGINNFPNIYFVRQKDQRGLADAIRYAKQFTDDEDFVVLLGDTIYRSASDKTVTSQLLSLYEKERKPCLMVEEVPRERVSDYGIIDAKQITEDIFSIKNVVEKPSVDQAASNLGITGIYVLGNYVYDYLHSIKPGVNGEYQLSDAYNIMVRDMDILALRMHGKRYDIGSKELWIRTFVEFAKEKYP